MNDGRRCCGAVARTALAVLVAAAAGAAQQGSGDPARPQPPERTGRPDPFLQPNQPQQPRDPLDPVWGTLPRPSFDGFPVFPSRLSGYGGYPQPARPLQPGQLPTVQFPPGLMPLLPVAAPEPPGWPAWVRLAEREPLPFAPDRALLVQNSDRVWWRGTTDEPFVPLFFHDKLRALEPGAEVEVRQSGEFELLLHTSSRVVATGPTELRLVAMDAGHVELDLRSFTRLRVQARDRDHVLRLPDGSRLEAAAPAPDEAAPGPVLLLLQRADEPSRYGGRATIFNIGARPVRWVHAFGTTTLEPDHRVTMFLRPPAIAVGAGLAELGGRAEPTSGGRALDFRGADDAELSWCGARFQVGAGSVLRLDAGQGAPFAPIPLTSNDTP
ncbi:MAG: hypothetical protein JNL08_14330 [Planctomycetes bacterium]|nr:hypothetical protein [Planctomycetota bacterium]